MCEANVLLRRMVFGLYSKEWFGLGIDEWEDGAQADAITKAIQETFAVVGAKSPDPIVKTKAKLLLTRYMEAAIAVVGHCSPPKYLQSSCILGDNGCI